MTADMLCSCYESLVSATCEVRVVEKGAGVCSRATLDERLRRAEF